ncbi:hypothetical protein [Luteipulveratus flavus]|uniref:Cadherin-like beta sandwich domain-containing protein n=1 Tax=Luteipulveratus flavus TaxID=3031728 RepID=A0ABT6CA21_9MICO|nr:hypothetical protein [Luteipulveratus sp. YIM 133296]MDF8265167.1 hypothetical protein [Luteipulveratus sp. YIM 133296]
MLNARKRLQTSVLAVALGAGVSACGGDDHDARTIKKVVMGGSEVTNPQALLDGARSQFLSVNQAAIDAKSASVSDSSSCFFRRESAGSETVVPKVFCGPIRRAGSSASQVWDTYDASVMATDDPAVLATVATESNAVLGNGVQQSTTVDPGLLVRPDGATPGDGSKLAEPQAPQSTLRDYAALLPEAGQQTGFTFKNLTSPARLVTPSATITVEAEAQPTTVPGMIDHPTPADDDTGWSESDSPDTETAPAPVPSAPAVPSRAAEGQQLRAYRVTIEPGGPYPDPNASTSYGYSTDSRAKDASTSLSISVGGQRLSVHGATIGEDTSYGDESEQTTVAITCKSLPCSKGAERQSYVLFVSSANGQAASLRATVDGQALSLPLTGGAPTGSVSTVGNTRKNLQQQTNVTWPSQEVKVGFDPEYKEYDKTATFGGGVPVVFLTPFDTRMGWAPKGQAWLEVPVTNRPDTDTDFQVAGSAYWLETGAGRVSEEADAGSDSTVVFKVPENFTTGTVKYQPSGSVKGVNTDGILTKPFKLAQPMVVSVSIPAG